MQTILLSYFHVAELASFGQIVDEGILKFVLLDNLDMWSLFLYDDKEGSDESRVFFCQSMDELATGGENVGGFNGNQLISSLV